MKKGCNIFPHKMAILGTLDGKVYMTQRLCQINHDIKSGKKGKTLDSINVPLCEITFVYCVMFTITTLEYFITKTHNVLISKAELELFYSCLLDFIKMSFVQ